MQWGFSQQGPRHISYFSNTLVMYTKNNGGRSFVCYTVFSITVQENSGVLSQVFALVSLLQTRANKHVMYLGINE